MIAELLALSIQGRNEHINDLRHAVLSLWLNATGHLARSPLARATARVLQDFYRHCIDFRSGAGDSQAAAASMWSYRKGHPTGLAGVAKAPDRW